MKIILVVGARPNFMKAAPVYKAFKNKYPEVEVKICHTGQHYDSKMSDVFFQELGMPEPEFYLGVGSGSHAVQTAAIMTEFEKVCTEEKPDIVMVAGDVNSTIACSLTAVKLGIKIAHIEAGLRSFDRSMPEEINRILTDCISDYYLVTEKSGIDNLLKEGVETEKIYFTGNCMIDSLVSFLSAAKRSIIREQLGINKNYLLLTFHRPSNVDNPEFYEGLKTLFIKYRENYQIVFPVHPRTRKRLEELNIESDHFPGLILTEPLGYIDFLNLITGASCIVTDSGGVQEESTYLKVPCITVRNNTERPVTVEVGSNYLAGADFDKVFELLDNILSGIIKESTIPDLWDGKAGERVAMAVMGDLAPISTLS